MDQTSTVRFRAKNIGSPNIKFRVEGTAEGQEFKFIFDAGESKAWMWLSAIGWQDISEYMQSYFQQFQQQFNGYTTQLSGWTGGDWTYADPTTGATVRIYDIVVNPSLPDSRSNQIKATDCSRGL